MKTETSSSIWPTLLVALVLALIGGTAFSVWLLGADRLMTLGLILISAIAIALVLVASAAPIRAYRRKDPTNETIHHINDGTRTIIKERVLDGRAIEAPKIYQLPAQPQGGQFPELLRAAYQAGRISPQSSVLQQPPSGYEPESAYIEGELHEVDLSDDGWSGDITIRRP